MRKEAVGVELKKGENWNNTKTHTDIAHYIKFMALKNFWLDADDLFPVRTRHNSHMKLELHVRTLPKFHYVCTRLRRIIKEWCEWKQDGGCYVSEMLRGT